MAVPVLAAAGILLLGWVLAESGLFRIRDMGAVEVRGNRRLSRGEVLAASGIRPGMGILSLDRDAAAARICSHPWVAAAAVERCFPSRVRIVVKERQPVALVVRDGRLHYVDGEGDVFAPAKAGDDLDFPVVTGLSKADLVTGAGREALRRAVGLVTSVKRNSDVFSRQILSEVHVARDGELVIFLADNIFPVRIGRSADRLRRFAMAIKYLSRKRLLGVTRFMDVDYGGRILVRLAVPVV